MLEFLLTDAKPLYGLLESVSYMDDIQVTASDSGLSIVMVDSLRCIIIAGRINVSLFDEYIIDGDEPIKFRVPMKIFLCAIKYAADRSSHPVRCKVNPKKSDKIDIISEGRFEMSIHLMDAENDVIVDLNKLNKFKSDCRMSCKMVYTMDELINPVSVLAKGAETVSIVCICKDKGRFVYRFIVESDAGDNFLDKLSITSDETVKVDVKNPESFSHDLTVAKNYFSPELLVRIIKQVFKIFNRMEMYLSKNINTPLKLKFICDEYDKNVELTCYLSARISNDNS